MKARTRREPTDDTGRGPGMERDYRTARRATPPDFERPAPFPFPLCPLPCLLYFSPVPMKSPFMIQLTTVTMSAPRKADVKSSIEKPDTKYAVSARQAELITKMKRPSVRRV